MRQCRRCHGIRLVLSITYSMNSFHQMRHSTSRWRMFTHRRRSILSMNMCNTQIMSIGLQRSPLRREKLVVQQVITSYPVCCSSIQLTRRDSLMLSTSRRICTLYSAVMSWCSPDETFEKPGPTLHSHNLPLLLLVNAMIILPFPNDSWKL